MIFRQPLVEKLKSLGYRFHQETVRVQFWRKSGSTQRVMLHRKDTYPDDVVKTVLRQCGVEEKDIADFLKEKQMPTSNG